MIDGEKYAKFDEDVDASKTYGTMGDNGVVTNTYTAGDQYQDNYYAADNRGFQESTFTEYPNQQVSGDVCTMKQVKKLFLAGSNGSECRQSLRNQGATGTGGCELASVHVVHRFHAEINEDPVLDEPLLLDVTRVLLAVLHGFRRRGSVRWQSESELFILLKCKRFFTNFVQSMNKRRLLAARPVKITSKVFDLPAGEWQCTHYRVLVTLS